MTSNNIPFPPSLSPAKELMGETSPPRDVISAAPSESEVGAGPASKSIPTGDGKKAHVFPRERVEAAMQRAAANGAAEELSQ